ncbi:GNAT family N-acetyltransferase [Alicyclobacillus mali]|uniref:GNAT family N-acetyltransferase n=1 Tax=Alicyclobacillus mali (ex Roth et al. 2021) TaxID=1123961 RepID=A0ABS0F0Y6_9BACL|nr:GNAT family N-acetyltransferase [Alicyclobacillus mali (ex Roth et al. 2021)]MBF8376969.1 GNAT family N-acetyltransferase [Alicyclobacillus mali (ex Roth et al. 2021)]MCL6488926.1 GNAT family N-acetyltransferase [Alicyclobacillus mali (ex Roth et al. 2021)]
MPNRNRSRRAGPKGSRARSHAKPTTARQVASHAVPAEEVRYRSRRAEDDDWIVQLARRELGVVHEQAFGEPFPESELRQYLQSGMPTVVIERNGRPVGFYSYLPSAVGKVHVSALVIDSKFQRKGIGRKAMEHLEAEVRRTGAHTLEVFIQDVNPSSLAFAKQLGFREVARVEPRTLVLWKVISPGPVLPPMSMPF